MTAGELVHELVGRSPFARRVGLRLELLEPGMAEVVLPAEAGVEAPPAATGRRACA